MLFLDTYHRPVIKQIDAQQIVSFHQLGYFVTIENLLNRLEKKLAKIQTYKTTKHYFLGMFDNLNKDLATISSEVYQKKEPLEKDLIVLKRNIDFITRMKINLISFIKE